MVKTSQLNKSFLNENILKFIPSNEDNIDKTYLQRSLVLFVESFFHRPLSSNDNIQVSVYKNIEIIYNFAKDDNILNFNVFLNIYLNLFPELNLIRKTNILNKGIAEVSKIEKKIDDDVVRFMKLSVKYVKDCEQNFNCEIKTISKILVEFLSFEFSMKTSQNVIVGFFLINYLFIISGYSIIIPLYDINEIAVAFDLYKKQQITYENISSVIGKKIIYSLDYTIENIL